MNIYLDMIGCRLNQSELEVMARQFKAAGHTLVGDPAQADLAVVNTCTVTAAAAADSRKTIRRIARSGVSEIIATGCWSELEPEAALALPGVTQLVKNHQKGRLVTEYFSLDDGQVDLEPLERIAIPGSRQRTRAFIKAQDGCRHQCAFCVTTIARGDSRSETAQQVIREVHGAVRSGIKEVVLTGVQLGSWGKDLSPPAELADLVKAVLDETDIPQLRLSSIEPWDITSTLIEMIGHDRVARHLHLPLQSGSAVTLRRMTRAITPERYQQLLAEIRSSIPEVAITTDILTGFPGETEQEFQEGMDFIQEMEFSGGHVFTFSAREGTRAAVLPDQIPHPVRKARSAELRKLLEHAGEKYRKSFLQQELSVLWEQYGEEEQEAGILVGLTDNYMRVRASGSADQWNQFSCVSIDKLESGGVWGTILASQAEGEGRSRSTGGRDE